MNIRNTIIAAVVLALAIAGSLAPALAVEADQSALFLPLAILDKNEKMLDRVIPITRFSLQGSLFFTNDGQYLASRGEIWPMAAGMESLATNIPFYAITRDSTLAAYHDSYAEKILLWETIASKTTHELSIPSTTVNTAAFSPDGRMLAAAGGIYKDLFVIVWDAQTGDKIKRLKEFDVSSLAFSPDGRFLAGATQAVVDGETIIWELSERPEIRFFLPRREAGQGLSQGFGASGEEYRVPDG